MENALHLFTYIASLLLIILGATGKVSAKASTNTGLILAGVGVLCFLPCLVDFVLSCCLIRRARRRTQLLSDASDGHLKAGLARAERKLPIVFSPAYNITACGIEKVHPFDSVKYGRVMARLRDGGTVSEDEVVAPDMATREQLLLAHSPWYLAKLHSATYLTTIVEVPICCLPSWFVRTKVLQPMLYATGGSILGARLALERGWAINLSGGYHHASGSSGSGFCVYADITLAIQHLRRDRPDRVKRVMIVDLDAHQGNGHERDFLNDPQTFIVDFYNPQIFPGDHHAKKAIACPVYIRRESDDRYMELLQKHLADSFQKFSPDFVLYNAGTDCMDGDPLGGMRISPEGIIRRDEIMFRAALERRVPILMVLSGGYQQSNAPVIGDSIANLERKLGIITAARQAARGVTVLDVHGEAGQGQRESGGSGDSGSGMGLGAGAGPAAGSIAASATAEWKSAAV